MRAEGFEAPAAFFLVGAFAALLEVLLVVLVVFLVIFLAVFLVVLPALAPPPEAEVVFSVFFRMRATFFTEDPEVVEAFLVVLRAMLVSLPRRALGT